MSNIPNINQLVERFLSWPLPKSVCADPCASNPDYPGRSGTNLLNADEARQMLEHVLGPATPVQEHGISGDAVEWLCDQCNCIHPRQRHGLVQPCPDCKLAMRPTSFNLREIERLRAMLTTPHSAQPALIGEAYLCDKCQTPFDGAYCCSSCGHNTATKKPVYAARPPTEKGSSA